MEARSIRPFYRPDIGLAVNSIEICPIFAPLKQNNISGMNLAIFGKSVTETYLCYLQSLVDKLGSVNMTYGSMSHFTRTSQAR